jgi:hypothetical protein
MATTNFTPGTLIESDWLNDVDEATYEKLSKVVSPDSYGSLADWMTAYNALSVNNADIGNNGNALALAAQLLINNGYSTTLGNTTADRKKNALLVVSETPDTTPQDPDDSRVTISTTVATKGAQQGNAIRANLQNYSTDGNGCTSVYASADSDTLASWSAALHGETRNSGGSTIGVNSENASYGSASSMYGVVVKQATYGSVDPHPLSGASKVDVANSNGVYITGNSDQGDMYGWRYGVWIDNKAIKSTGKAIYVQAPSEYGLHMSAESIHGTADVLLEGDSDHGIICNGAYTNSAIKLADDQYMAWTGTNTIKTRFSVTDGQYQWEQSGIVRVAFEVDTSPRLLFNGNQVLREQIGGWTAATGTPTRTTFATSTVTTAQLAERVKALIDDLISHGLIGA